jgi:hypothetical protein
MLGADDLPWRYLDGDGAPVVLEFTVEGRPVDDRLGGRLVETSIDLGGAISLRGYRVEGDASPGGEIRITYAWYAREPPPDIYAVFNHLTTADGAMVAQVDGWPLEGRLPTTHWLAREFVEDTYILEIPRDAAPGPYRLYTGMYSAATGVRLPAYLGSRRLLDDRVPIPLPEDPEW